MRTFVAILTLFLAVTVTTASECKWGPAYWCLSETTATKCGQLRYCQQNVWKSTETQQKTSSVDMESKVRGFECEVCTILVKFIEKEVLDNKTESEAKDEVEKLCKDLGSLSSECTELVNEYFDAIWNLLVQEISPDEICKDLKLCDSGSLTKKKKEEEVKQELRVGDVECDVCELIARFLERFIYNNSTEEEAEAAVEKVCKLLPEPESSLCTTFVKDYFPTIWKLLEQETEPDEICSILKLCSSVAVSSAGVKASACDLCKDLDEFLQPYVDNNVTEEEVKAFVLDLCNFLTLFDEDAGKECMVIYDNFDVYWKFLQSELNGDEFCYEFGLCSQTRTRTQAVVRVKTTPPPPSSSHEVDPSLCDICKEVVEFVANFINENGTEDEIEKYLDDFCADLPSEDVDQCKELVKDYLPLIWLLIKSEVANDEICYQIKFCTQTQSAAVETKTTSSVMEQQEQQSACEYCKLIVSFMAVFVDENTTKDELKDVLEMVCGLLPDEITDECNSFVGTYYMVIYELLKAEVDNDQICYQIKVCTRTAVVEKKKRRETSAVSIPQGTVECDFCKLMVRAVKPLIDSNVTEKVLKEFLEGLCDIELIPKEYRDECETFLKVDFTLFYEIIQEEMDEGKLCELLEACNASSTAAALPRQQIAVKGTKTEEPEFLLCTLCEFIVNKLIDMVVDNATEAELLDELKKICDVFDDDKDWKDECMEIVDKYGEEIVNDVIKGLGARAICTLIDLCTLANNNKKTTSSLMMKMKVNSEKLSECSICEFALLYLKEIAGTNATEEVIKDLLAKVCDRFPSSIKDECTDFIDEYQDEVIELVVQDIESWDPEKVCEKVDLCPKQTVAMATQLKKLGKSFRRA